MREHNMPDKLHMYIIDGRYVFNALRNSEVVLNFEQLGTMGNMRRYYTSVLRGRKPPGIIEWLRWRGFKVKVHQGNYETDHAIDMVMDLVHLAHVYREQLEISLITDNTTLSSAINLVEELGVQVTLIGPNDSVLKRNSYRFLPLSEFMTNNELNQAKDFTIDKLEARSWLGLHDDIPGEDPRGLIKEF
jgi:hypothetical protein